MTGTIRWGTSSWSEKTWVGSFYPKGTPPGDFLSIYADTFDTVEADVTYYRIPDVRMVAGWVRKTPAGFTLSAKFIFNNRTTRYNNVVTRFIDLDNLQLKVTIFKIRRIFYWANVYKRTW